MAKKKNQKTRPEPERHWIKRTAAIESCGISRAAFDKWNVQPVAQIGRDKYYTVQEILENRIRHLEKKHADQILILEDQANPDKLSPILEKARLDRSRRVGQDLLNDKIGGDLIPIDLSVHVVGRLISELVAIFDSLPAKIKRVMPSMTATQQDTIKREVAKVRNAAADVPNELDEYIEEYYSEAER